MEDMAKRKRIVDHVDREHDEESRSIKRKSVDQSKVKLLSFISWCDRVKLITDDKVKVTREGSCHEYGMVAVDQIKEGECLFTIPRDVLLNPDNSSIKNLLEKEAANIQSESGWVPLLLCLMHEYTNPDSNWRPYMDLVPDFDHLHLPYFWNSDDLSTLKGTGVIEAVERDREAIEKEFNDLVLPFIQRNCGQFTPECSTLEFYGKMVSFVMAYGFSDVSSESEDKKSPPMMVPMADILNHVANNNAHLLWKEDCLRMVAVRDIDKGEEIYNTYGELSNWQLLHSYGFCEPYPHNFYDVVEIKAMYFLKAMEDIVTTNHQALDLLKEKWRYLVQLGLVGDDEVFVLGVEEIITEEEICEMFKVLFMTSAAFKEHTENNGWSEDTDEYSLSNENIKQIPSSWKNLLYRVCQNEVSRDRYYSSFTEDEQIFMNKTLLHSLPVRLQHSLNVRYGQQKLLFKMIELCKSQKNNIVS